VSATAASTTEHDRSWLRRSARREDPRSFKVLAGIVIFVDLGILTVGWMVDRPAVVWDLALWVVLVACAGLVPLTSGEDGPNLSMDLPLLIGAAIVYGPVVAGTIAFLAMVDLREMKRMLPPLHAVFSRAQVSLSVVAAGAAFRAFGGVVGDWPWVAVAGLMALVADVAINYLAVGAMTAMTRHRPLLKAIHEMQFGPAEVFVPTYVCFGFLGVLLAEAHQTLGFWGVLAFVAPVVLARQAFLHRKLLDTAVSSLLVRKHALRQLDERIAEERRDERARIAEALHDDVLQDLYNVSIRTRIIKEDLRMGRLLDLDVDVPSLLSASEHAVEDLRDVIRDLRRSPVGHAGLVDTLNLLVNHLRDESPVKFVTELSEVHVEASKQLLVYQMAREALMNSIKHADARAVWLRLTSLDGLVQLTVEDDGRGFDPARIADSRHFGLELLKERAEAAGADLEIRSKPGIGTVVSVTIPCD
jgi:signal transduction histidine kinase